MAGSFQYWKHCSCAIEVHVLVTAPVKSAYTQKKFKGPFSGQGFIMRKLSLSSCFNYVRGGVNT